MVEKALGALDSGSIPGIPSYCWAKGMRSDELDEGLRYNKQCPGHDHYCWSHRALMREDDLVCTKDYRRLPEHLRQYLWKIKKNETSTSSLSIIVDWLLENPTEEELFCTAKDN